MPFKLVLMPPDFDEDWPEAISDAVPECEVKVYSGPQDFEDADVVYGRVPPEHFSNAKKLRWIAASRAGLGGAWFYDALVNSDVVVTGMHGSYNEMLSQQIMAFLLAYARRFHVYLPRQREGSWERAEPSIELTGRTVAVVGVGGSGAEAGRLCAAFRMRVIGFDPRRTDVPEGFETVLPPAELENRIGEADFVLITAPETPATVGMFNLALFGRMKRGSFLINISRGALVKTDDLVEALRSGQLGGAGLDVMDPEPLPPDHPLWTMPNVMITPHTGIYGAPYRRRWLELVIENCKRFVAGRELLNVVDKREWF